MTPLLLLLAAPAAEVAPPPRPGFDLTGFVRPKDAVKAKQADARPARAAVAGYVGVEVAAGKDGRPTLDVAPDSPAEAAGLKPGDVLLKLADEPVTAVNARDRLRGLTAGDAVPFAVERSGKALALTVTPRAASRPLSASPSRPVLGIQVEAKDRGIAVTTVSPGGGADAAGMKTGDLILRVDGKAVAGDNGLRDALGLKAVGELVTLLVKRGEKELELKAKLGESEAATGRRPGGWDDRLPSAWRKPGYKLAILGVEFPDAKHNPKIAGEDWEKALFSVGGYRGKSVTGQTVHGSAADYYKEISYDRFRLEGDFVGWVEVPKKRAEYATGTGTGSKSPFLTEALDKLLAKDKDALKGYDGVFFLYAGDRVQTTRGGLFWPHRATVTHKGTRWSYFIVPEGGTKMTDISVICHEFGHMLGLPDLYARPENPGSEGVGAWCAMSQQNGAGRPQHFSAWSKEQLGWLNPTVIDPRVKQKIVLAPVEDDPTECLKVLVKPDGSEYFLIENRKRKGFDADLPGEGLLIWRVVGGKVFLEEAHGVEGPTGPRVYLGGVPFPSPANDSFTPFTTPSSKAQLGGGWDVYLSNIRRLSDGRVALHVGYQFQ